MTCRRPISNKKYLYQSMPSRKRNKGKVRKAKKAELEAEQIDEVRRPVHYTGRGGHVGWILMGRLLRNAIMGVIWWYQTMITPLPLLLMIFSSTKLSNAWILLIR